MISVQRMDGVAKQQEGSDGRCGEGRCGFLNVGNVIYLLMICKLDGWAGTRIRPLDGNLC